MADKSASHSRWIWHNLLLILLIFSMIGGIVTGVTLRGYDIFFSHRHISYFAFPGEILMRLLKMITVPLIVSSLISGIASLNLKASERIGLRAAVFFVSTTLISALLGLTICLIARPGEWTDSALEHESGPKGDTAKELPTASSVDALLDLLRNLFPSNIAEACFKMTRTVRKDIMVEINGTLVPIDDYDIKMVTVDRMNMLGLVFISVTFGMAMSALNEQCKTLIELFQALELVTMRLVSFIMWYSPVGIFFLIAAKIVQMESGSALFKFLAFYAATVVVGLLIHGFIALPSIYFILTRNNPFRFISGIMPAMATAMGTASSSATMPITLQCLEERNKVDQRVARFVLPLGTTINMDGTSLYLAVASIYIAQFRGISLSFANYLTIVVTSGFASIGAAGIPHAAMVAIIMVLSSVGLDPQDVALVVAIDWIIDRFRTLVNVMGDSFGAGIVHHLSKHELVVRKPRQMLDQEQAVAMIADYHSEDRL